MKCYVVPSGLAELFYPDRWLKSPAIRLFPFREPGKKWIGYAADKFFSWYCLNENSLTPMLW
jgi:hypothetical protein